MTLGSSRLDLDEIHEMLEWIEHDKRALEAIDEAEINVGRLDDTCYVIHTLSMHDRTEQIPHLAQSIGVSQSILNKFIRFTGHISKREAIHTLDRIRSFLRALDLPDEKAPETRPSQQSFETSPNAAPEPVRLPAESWVTVTSSRDTKLKITVIAGLLDSILAQVAHSNLPSEQQVLTTIEREQLIAVLKTALHVLQAPMLERSILRRAGDGLRDVAKKAAEKNVQEGLSQLSRKAAELIADLISNL